MTAPTDALIERLRAEEASLREAALAVRPHPANSIAPVHAGRVSSFVDKEVALACLTMHEAADRIESLLARIEAAESEILSLRKALSAGGGVREVVRSDDRGGPPIVKVSPEPRP